MTQSRSHSVLECVVSTLIGYWVAVGATALVFPLFGIPVETGKNLIISAFFTAISLVRSYLLRRLFNWWHHRDQFNLVPMCKYHYDIKVRACDDSRP